MGGEVREEVCAKPEMITHSFRKCGISIAMDNSEDEVIKINGIDHYTSGPSSHRMMTMTPCEESDAVVTSSEYTSSDTKVESSLQVHSA